MSERVYAPRISAPEVWVEIERDDMGATTEYDEYGYPWTALTTIFRFEGWNVTSTVAGGSTSARRLDEECETLKYHDLNYRMHRTSPPTEFNHIADACRKLGILL